MIDIIIKKLLALPKLEVSPEILMTFLRRTNDIIFHGKPITLAAFKADLEENPETSITKEEVKNIECYLKAWEELIPVLGQLTKHIQTGWECVHNKPIGADDLVPLFIAFFSLNTPLLPELHEKLQLARDVNVSNYFINLLSAACEYLVTDGDLDQEDIQECLPFIRDLFLEDGLSLLKLEKEMQYVCRNQIKDYAESIYADLKIHQIDTYDFDSTDMSKSQRIAMQATKITEMHANIKDHPFTSYPELGDGVKKFIAFNEFLISLNRTHANNVFERLREFTYKYTELKISLGNDLSNIDIKFHKDTKAYLNVPDEKRPSVLNLLFPHPDNYSMKLKQFMDLYLSPKITELEIAEDVRKAPMRSVVSNPAFV